MLKCTSHAAKLKARLLNIWKWSFYSSKNNTFNWKRKKYMTLGKEWVLNCRQFTQILLLLYTAALPCLKPFSSSDILKYNMPVGLS